MNDPNIIIPGSGLAVWGLICTLAVFGRPAGLSLRGAIGTMIGLNVALALLFVGVAELT